jgi:tetratricopeptide (TPR) repeat protein
VEPEQIFQAAPENFDTQGDTVCWVFTDIKPKGKEYDVRLEYLRPDIFRVLSDFRKRHAARPNDAALTIKLAKHLFALGRAKGNAGDEPDRLELADFDAVFSKIENSADQAFFKRKYIRRADGAYHEPGSESMEDSLEMIRILNAADYQSAYSRSPHVAEARQLIEQLLEAKPDNAEAWNVYLANYNQFSFGSVGIWSFGPCQFYPRQIELIERAHRLCPDDPAIGLWFERCREKAPIDGRVDPLSELLKKNGVFQTDYPRIEYDYH